MELKILKFTLVIFVSSNYIICLIYLSIWSLLYMSQPSGFTHWWWISVALICGTLVSWVVNQVFGSDKYIFSNIYFHIFYIFIDIINLLKENCNSVENLDLHPSRNFASQQQVGFTTQRQVVLATQWQVRLAIQQQVWLATQRQVWLAT